MAEVGHDPVELSPAGLLARVERPGDRTYDARRLRNGREVNEDRAILGDRRACACRLDGQASLADASDTGQRHHASGAKQAQDVGNLRSAADERGQRKGQIVMSARSGDRRDLAAQHCALQGAQVVTGLQAELLVEHLARSVVRPQGIRLAPGVVERQHQRAPQPLSVGVSSDERLELVGQLGRFAQLDVGRNALLQRVQTQLLEAVRLDRQSSIVGQVGKWTTAPQRERLGESVPRCTQASDGELLIGASDQAFEFRRIHPMPIDVEPIAGGRAENRRTLTQRLAKARYVAAQRGRRTIGRLSRPELVDEPVTANAATGLNQQ